MQDNNLYKRGCPANCAADNNTACRKLCRGFQPPLPRSGRNALAFISFGFDREAEGAGPYLDPLNPQSTYAPAFLELARTVLLTDPAYIARLEAHYRQVKKAVARPTPAVREVMRRYRLAAAEGKRPNTLEPILRDQ